MAAAAMAWTRVLVLLLGSILDSGSLGSEVPIPSLAERAFTAVWNVKNTDRCSHRFGVNLGLDKYDIATNPPASTDVTVMALFGHDDIGIYPYITSSGKFVNGGLPQLVNLTSHLEKAATDIVTAIPDANYSGLGVIDWEYWSPSWDWNGAHKHAEIYQEESVSLVRNRHPEWDSEILKTVAKAEFEQAGKALYEGTLRLAKLLRPRGLWGFYHIPLCDIKDQKIHVCSNSSKRWNDDLYWIADSSSSLYPSIYLHANAPKKGHPLPSTRVRVEANLNETFRVRGGSRNPKAPIFSYCNLNYSRTNLRLNLEDLNNTILLSAERGLSGVVLWGDNYDTKDRTTCLQLRDYIRAAAGPLILQITRAAARCSHDLCSGHGRCAGKILECDQRCSTRAPSGGENLAGKCVCQCYAGWTGSNCDTRML